MKSTFFAPLLALSLTITHSAVADDTPLAEQMDGMNSAYKAFRRTDNAQEGAASAREAQGYAAKSLLELPEMLKKMPDGPEKAKASAKYRKMMAELYAKLCEVEVAFLENRMDDVAGLVDELKELKKQGHDAFMEEE